MARFTLQPLQPPAQWADFESLCRDLWAAIWEDPDTQKNGRQGQPQAGVDVFGRPGRREGWGGVQCKLKKQLSGGRLTRKEIEEEVEKARKFEPLPPGLSEYVIATTARNDVEAQQAARQITAEQLEKDSFPVTVFSWDEIWERLEMHPEVMGKYYPEVDTTLLKARRDYLAALFSDLEPLPLLGVAGAGRAGEIPLIAVYTDLDITDRVVLESSAEEGQHAPRESSDPMAFLRQRLQADNDESKRLLARLRQELAAEAKDRPPRRAGGGETVSRPLTALEAAALAPRLALVGAPGSGKSTFARHLALCLAGESLGRAQANLDVLNPRPGNHPADLAWRHGPLLPVFLELRRFVGSPQFPAEEETGSADHLLNYLVEQRGKTISGLAPMLLDQLGSDVERAVLILDGLDETSAASQIRGRLRQVIASFCSRFPSCRVLLTSRPYAYRAGSEWRLDDLDFGSCELADFDRTKIRTFVQAWYKHRSEQGQLGPREAEEQARRLVEEIEAAPYLGPLAKRPLMLTMLTDLHAASGGHLRGGRGALFEASVELLLDRWNQMKRVAGLPDEGTVAELYGMTLDGVREALEGLAFRVHRERGQGEGGAPPEIDVAEIWKELDRRRPGGGQPVALGELTRYLEKRSGILLAETSESYRFPHRYYQEFLAACFLAKDEEFPELLVSVAREDPALWREVVLFTAAQSKPIMVRGLVNELVPDHPPAGLNRDAPPFSLAFLAALSLDEAAALDTAEKRKRWRRHPVRGWLEKTVELGALPIEDRAEAGRLVGILGDSRPGVGLGDDGLPEIEWVEVPAGSFWMGSGEAEKAAFEDEKPRHEVRLSPYRISRYPVTNAQYRAFVEDGGYTGKWRECWTKAGWEWKGDREGPADDPPTRFLVANHPRVNVSWYEARAFAQWLGRRRSLDIRLPTESEWERAARGPEGWRYPWGDEFEEDHCNSREAGVGRTTAVGSFPKGQSAEGVDDLAGNVLEWCRSKWREDYEKPAEDADAEGTTSRVVRGGSFFNSRSDVRCACRYGFEPDFRLRGIGFRLSAPI